MADSPCGLAAAERAALHDLLRTIATSELLLPVVRRRRARELAYAVKPGTLSEIFDEIFGETARGCGSRG